MGTLGAKRLKKVMPLFLNLYFRNFFLQYTSNSDDHVLDTGTYTIQI